MGKIKITVLAVVAVCILMALFLSVRPGIWARVQEGYHLITDRQWIRTTVESFGWAAPLVFIGIQIVQVLAAPIPGEATGFIGGYIFGTLEGFILSTIALSIGSLVNFSIGRYLGEKFVRRLIPKKKFDRLNHLINRQGIIFIFFMFVLPGFPKDYLSLLLGLSTLPFKVFALLATIGRMPGTLILSLQGASFYEKNYVLLGIVAGGCLLLALLAYRVRDSLYRWVERMRPPES